MRACGAASTSAPPMWTDMPWASRSARTPRATWPRRPAVSTAQSSGNARHLPGGALMLRWSALAERHPIFLGLVDRPGNVFLKNLLSALFVGEEQSAVHDPPRF